MIYARIDQVFLKHMIDTASVGLYDAAVRLSEVWYFIPNIVVAGLFPALMNAKKDSSELYAARARKLFLVVTIFTIGSAFLTTLFARPIVLIVFGSEFSAASSVLQIYIWSTIAIGMNLIAQYLLIAEKMGKYIAYSAGLGMIINIVLCILLIPIWGMYGAAASSVVAYLVPFIALFCFKDTRLLMRTIFAF